MCEWTYLKEKLTLVCVQFFWFSIWKVR